MKRALILIVAALLLARPVQAQNTNAAKADKPDKTKPLRVLFIGNSYTSVNDLPGMLEAMSAKAKGARPVEANRSLHGGWTLQKHMDDEKSKTQAMIKEGDWDFVVLQEQSQMPFMYPKVTHKYGIMLGKLIQEQKATPLFYMTWAREHQPENQAGIRDTYQALGKELNAPVAPVGLAWEKMLQQKVKITLHQKDRSHPTPEGTYLAACVFFAKIHGQSPEGLPGTLVTKQKKRSRTLCKLPADRAKLLQRTAWQVVEPTIKAQAN